MSKDSISIKLISAVPLLIVYILVFKIAYFDMIYDGFSRGFRYPVLIAEVIFFPLYFLGSLIHIVSKTYKNKIVDWSTVSLIAKYFAFFIFLFFVFFIAGMILN